MAKVMPKVDSMPTPAIPMPYRPRLKSAVKAPEPSTMVVVPPAAK